MPAVRAGQMDNNVPRNRHGRPPRRDLESLSPPDTSPPAPLDYPRRRAAIACEICRQRKTRCDGGKPRCGFCQEIDHECRYRQAPAAPPSKWVPQVEPIDRRLEQDINQILHRQANIDQTLQALLATFGKPPISSIDRQFPSPSSTLSSWSTDADEEVLGNNPVLIVHRPEGAVYPRAEGALKSIQNHFKFHLYEAAGLTWVTHHNFHEELCNPELPFAPFGGAWPCLDSAEIDRLFDVFFVKVHSWYPFLDPPSCKKRYADYTKKQPEFSSTYCLFLLIMALGTMAEDENAKGRNWAEKYAQLAFAMLSPVMISNDLVSAQCLVLFAIYFMWLIKPSQAWNFICYASNKIQNLLYWRMQTNGSHGTPEERELEKRVFWVAYIIESEHRIIYVNPGTRLDAYEGTVGLPFSPENPFPDIPGPEEVYERSNYFLLAHIKMRQSINKGTRLPRNPVRNESEFVNYPMVFALEEEINAWYQALPPNYRFEINFDASTFPRPLPLAPVIDNNMAWLRSSYLSCPAIFHWPAVQEAVKSSYRQLSSRHIRSVHRLLRSVMEYISSASQYMNRSFNPLVFTQASGFYCAALMSVVVMESRATENLVLPAIPHYVEYVLKILDYWAWANTTIKTNHDNLLLKVQKLKDEGRFYKEQASSTAYD